jgi:hypothetical protein
MSVCVYSVFVLFCIYVAALRRPDPPVERVLQTVYRITKLKKRPRSARAVQLQVDKRTYIITDTWQQRHKGPRPLDLGGAELDKTEFRERKKATEDVPHWISMCPQQDSSVGRTGLDSRQCKIFLFAASGLTLEGGGGTTPLIQWVPVVLSPVGLKRQGYEADLSHPSSAEVKKGAAIPLLPYMSSWHNA